MAGRTFRPWPQPLLFLLVTPLPGARATPCSRFQPRSASPDAVEEPLPKASAGSRNVAASASLLAWFRPVQGALDPEGLSPLTRNRKSRLEEGCERVRGSLGRSNNTAEAGRSEPRLRPLLHSPPSSPAPLQERGPSPSPILQDADLARGRGELPSAFGSVDPTSDDPQGQAERNQTRHPHLDAAGPDGDGAHENETSANGRVRYRFPASRNHQRRGGGRRGEGGSAVGPILASLVAACLLLRGDGRSVVEGLTGRLGSLHLGTVFIRTARTPEERGAATPRWPPSKPDLSAGSPADACELWGKTGRRCGGGGGGPGPQTSSPEGRLPRWWWFSTDRLVPASWVWWAAPAGQFLPTGGTSGDPGARLDHVGCRLVTLSLLPASCGLSRVRLAEGGFHFNPSLDSGAVLCHRCPATLGLDLQAPDPLRLHLAASPQCPVVRALMERHRGRAPVSASASASASVSASASASASAGVDRSDQAGLSEDGEGGGEGEGAERGGGGVPGSMSTLQLTTAVPSDTGYVLALTGSSMDHRIEPSPHDDDDGIATAAPSAPPPTQPAAAHGHRKGRGGVSVGEAVYPQFSTAHSRLDTFRSCPRTFAAIFPPETLVDLGFYYAGYADCVRCFYCGVGLKSWESQDNPLTEHVRWRPQCRFLLATKGPRCIQRVLDTINGASEAPPTEDPSTRGEEADGDLTSDVSQGGREGSGGSGREGQVKVVQQLMTMGFVGEDIRAARARLRTAGHTEDLDQMLQVLWP